VFWTLQSDKYENRTKKTEHIGGGSGIVHLRRGETKTETVPSRFHAGGLQVGKAGIMGGKNEKYYNIEGKEMEEESY